MIAGILLGIIDSMQKVGVVVLNYKKYDETFNCVDSLLMQTGVETKIIIVDNESTAETESALKHKYSNNSQVEILISNKNLGFACGMNLGIEKLRNENFGFIFIANSDLFFSGNTILADMLQVYGDNVGVISPFIKNVDDTRAVYITFKKKHMYARMIKTFIQGEVKHLMKKPVINAREKKIAVRQKNEILEDRFELTGSGYMYTPHFFEHYSRMYPETFLYQEEYATCIYLYKAKLKSAWADTDPVIHKHGASTPNNLKHNVKNKRMIEKGGKKKILTLMLKSYDTIRNEYN